MAAVLYRLCFIQDALFAVGQLWELFLARNAAHYNASVGVGASKHIAMSSPPVSKLCVHVLLRLAGITTSTAACV